MYHNFLRKKIGIWGTGAVGVSAFNFFSTYTQYLTILDTHFSISICDQLKNSLVTLTLQKNKSDIIKFLETNDYILVSPGIDFRPFISYRSKLVTEIDIYMQQCLGYTIGITGTLGKTSVTKALSDILGIIEASVLVGGNIGTPMLDLCHKKSTVTVLEFSSFQLEYAQQCAPDIAIITNIYPNHLDRHTTYKEYVAAKQNILTNQKSDQKSLISLECAPLFTHTPHTAYFSDRPPTSALMKRYGQHHLFWIKDNEIIHCFDNKFETLYYIEINSIQTFSVNWVIVIATLYLRGVPTKTILSLPIPPLSHAHRLEKIDSSDAHLANEKLDTVVFYNDSKSTIMPATISALQKLNNPNTILFLGGLSKGVDRSNYIELLKNCVKYIICFGQEAQVLHAACQKYMIAACAFDSLEKAFSHLISIVKPYDYVLFSPGGASFDLFNNYAHRGEVFKKLATQPWISKTK